MYTCRSYLCRMSCFFFGGGGAIGLEYMHAM